MKRVLLGLAVMALAAAGLAGSSSAASNPATPSKSTTVSAFGNWQTSTAATYTETTNGVVRTDGTTELTVERAVVDTATGQATLTTADVTEGFAFTVDAVRLTGASLTATGLSVTTCTFDENGNQIGCGGPTSVDVSVTWNGQGPLGHVVTNNLVNMGGFFLHEHSVDRSRNATARGTFGSATLSPADVNQASLFRSESSFAKHGH